MRRKYKAAMFVVAVISAAAGVWPILRADTPQPAIGSDNVVVNAPIPPSMGSGNTFVGPTDGNGNTVYNRGGTAIGDHACADATSVAIGAHANAGACERKP